MKHRVPAAAVPEGGARVFDLGGVEVAVFLVDGRYRALGGRCPHVRGPLALGRVEGGAVVCPWHGARFDLGTGEPVSGPAEEGVPVFAVRRLGDELEVEVPGAEDATRG